MVERKISLTLPSGESGTGIEVQVRESNERWSEVTLEDGTVMRIKLSVVSAVRVDGQYDHQGNPMYTINMVPTMAIVTVPDGLRKKIQ